jgi:hypothetical protein
MRLRKYEIRIYVSKNLYDSISLAAINRGTKMSQVAREKLTECSLPKKENVYPCNSDSQQQENQNNKTVTSSLTKIEKQLTKIISNIDPNPSFAQDHLKLLITMVDQFYFDTMEFFPNIPEKLTNAAASYAKQRHTQWLEKIRKILQSA